jgi:hypothetical protein
VLIPNRPALPVLTNVWGSKLCNAVSRITFYLWVVYWRLARTVLPLSPVWYEVIVFLTTPWRYIGVNVKLHSFLTSAFKMEVSCLLHAPAVLPPANNTSTYCLCPRASLDVLEKTSWTYRNSNPGLRYSGLNVWDLWQLLCRECSLLHEW